MRRDDKWQLDRAEEARPALRHAHVLLALLHRVVIAHLSKLIEDASCCREPFGRTARTKHLLLGARQDSLALALAVGH